MIDVANENLLTLSQAARRIPGRNGRKSLDVSAVYRWASRGVQDVVLETCQIGGMLYTSDEALQRFSERLTAARWGDVAGHPAPGGETKARKETKGHGF